MPLLRTSLNHLQVVEQLIKFKPPTFNGRDVPSVLDEWMESLESILGLVRCIDTERVACASFQLKEDARIWWISYWRMRPAVERDGLTWARFREILTEKYCPPSFQVQKETEFFNLRQGNMSVEEYERKFSDLSRYTHHLVDTELKRARRFRNGLRAEIRNVLSGQGLTTLAEKYERAEEVAASFAMDVPKLKVTESSGKRKRNDDGLNQEEEEYHNQQERGVVSKGYIERPTCKSCGKKHNGECLQGQNRCYRCKESGHTFANCPKKRIEKDGKESNSGTGGATRTFEMR